MQIQRVVDGDIHVLRITGRVSIEDADELDRFLAGLVAAGAREVVVDCEGITHIVSATVGSLLGFAERLKQATGRAGFVTRPPAMRRIGHQMDLSRFLAFEPDVPAAVRALRNGSGNGR